MASGVAVNDDCVTKFNQIKLQHTYQFAICKIEEMKEITVEHTAKPGTSYSEFVKLLPTDQGRYAIYDFPYKGPDGGARNKLLFIVWAPDTAPIKAKMLYASSKDAFKKKLVGIGAEIQATDASEIDEETVLARVLQYAR